VSGWRAALILAILALLGHVACAPEDTGPRVRDVRACAAISRFGNGAGCDPSSGDLAPCGGASGRSCGADRACYDDALYGVCTCGEDADCGAREGYVKGARGSVGLGPLTFRCTAGRCAPISP
jgi:hypothetical protein